MAKCVNCGVDNEKDPKLILAKLGENWICGQCLSRAIKRKVKEK